MAGFVRKQKVFIVGASGLIGYHLAHRLNADFLVSGCYFDNRVFLPNTQIYPVSLKNLEMLETVIRMQEPDFIINCMGITDRKQIHEHPKISDNMNVVLPVSLAVLASKLRAQFLHLSCADVYDGETGNYSEEDTSFTLDDSLGKQKITAHSYIRAQTLESTIFRVGHVVGVGHPYRLSSFDRIRVRSAKGEAMQAQKKRIHSYISTRSLTQALHQALSGPFPGKHRTFHLGGPALSEYDFLKGWLRVIGKDSVTVKTPSDEWTRNTSLNSDLFTKSFPAWKCETKAQLYLNLLADLSPGLGPEKWDKAVKSLGA